MVVFLIPIAVVGYKVWEQRRREEEERRKQQSDTTDTAASSCPDETDSDVGSLVAAESSLIQSPASSRDTETSEVTAFQSRQKSLLRSWKARASEVNASQEAAYSLLSSSASTPTSPVTETSEAACYEQKQNALLRSWRARASAATNATLIDEPSVSPDLRDLLDLPPHSNAAEVEPSLLLSWSHRSEESAAIVSPIASS